MSVTALATDDEEVTRVEFYLGSRMLGWDTTPPFAVDWNSSRMIFSVDGNAFFTADKATIESTRGPWVFDHPFFIILNNAVGGDWPGPPGAGTVLQQDMVIDYVRVYQ